MMEPTITLKWGTLKGWSDIETGSVAADLLKRYHDFGASMSAAMQHDTPEQQQILIDLVSLPGIKTYLSWDEKYVNKAEAIDYITQYRQGAAQ